MSFQNFRPQGYRSTSDKKLADISKKLQKLLNEDTSNLVTFHLSSDNARLQQTAIMITEFAEDVWWDIGMWRALEQFNQETFGNPLPFSKPETTKLSDSPFDKYRLRHLLWNIFLILAEGDVISPHHTDLSPLAEKIAKFLDKEFVGIPKQSSVQKFLSSPNKTGIEVKRKLVWMGKDSYLFRLPCNFYLYDNDAINASQQDQIATLDDFMNQQTTIWSGLGVLDFLIETIGLKEVQKKEVQMWYERHLGMYHILEIKRTHLEAKNLLNDKIYHIDNQPSFSNPFRKKMVVYGSTVPFDGKWYWSGTQASMGNYDKKKFDEICTEFYHNSPKIIYRYHPEKAAMAREQMDGHYNFFVEYFGDDLMEYKTGREAAQASIDKIEAQRKKAMKEYDGVVDKNSKHYQKMKDMSVENVYSKGFLKEKNGVALFYNKGIGEELVSGFNRVKNALKKKGKNLSVSEIEILQSYIQDDSTSKDFILRLVKEYGDESFAAAFFIHHPLPSYWLDYLLRKYKGQDYRNRYPNLAVITD